jgi:hypothetical protein
MKPDRALIVELEKDLRLSPTGKVLYLEGHTDVPVFLGLVGHPLPETIETEGLAVDGIWIRGLGARQGSGGHQVRRLVRVAHERAYGPIRGLIDGDGEPYDALISGFRESGAGEPHRWPTYCIENWLPQSGWPPEWGDAPRWSEVLEAYVPYAALNRVVARVQNHLASSGVAKHAHPAQGPLETVAQVRARLGGAEPPPLAGTDLVAAFDAEVERCRSALARSLSHGHALINGKWLVDHHACAVTGEAREHCRRTWSSHVAALGGHPMVREWWARFVAT